jgi:multicomponent Na+:H+ antiporter subunit E
MRRALRMPMMLLWLTVLWVLLWGNISWANVLSGLVVALGVVLLAQLDSASLRPTYFRPWWAARYLITLIWKLFVSNIRLAYEILTPGDGTYTGIIAVPIRGGSDAVVNLVANSITLTPGTMTIDVKRHESDDESEENELTAGATLYVHGMYTQDVEAVRHDILELEALALRAFGTTEDYERAASDVVAHEPHLRRPETPEVEK